MYSIIPRILEQQERIEYRSYNRFYSKLLSNYNVERQNCINCLNNLHSTRQLRVNVTDIQYIHGYHVADPDKFKSILFPAEFDAEDYPITRKARDNWYTAKGISKMLIGEYDDAISYCLKNLNLLKKERQVFSDNDIIKCLNNIIFICIISGKSKLFKEFYDELLTYQNSKVINHYDFKFYALYLRLRYQTTLLKPDLEKLRDKSYEVGEILMNNDSKFNSAQKDILFLAAIFGTIRIKDYSFALKLLNRWNIEVLSTMNILLRKTMAMVIYYELNFYKILKSELISFKIMKKRKNIQSETYNVLIKFFERSVKAQSQIEKEKLFDKLIHLSSDHREKNYFLEFNPIFWAAEK